jgi:hypothetical protein
LANGGLIALNTNENTTYYDFQWKFNTRILLDLPVKSSRFYLNAITNSFYYKISTFLDFQSSIDQIGNITFQVLNSSYSKSIITGNISFILTFFLLYLQMKIHF